MGLAAYGYKPRSAYARRYRLDFDGRPYYLRGGKRPWWAESAVRMALEVEYKRHLPAFTAAYNASPPALKMRIEQADADFNAHENPLPFIRWARTIVPGAFPLTLREEAREESLWQQERLVRAAEAGFQNASPTALEPPPQGVLYHGSRDAQALRTEGLYAQGPDTCSQADPEYGWHGCWRSETWHSYKHDLSREQRARFHKMIGARPTSGGNLGYYVNLFWVSRRISVAESHGRSGGVFMLDQAKIRYYWWFPDEILGEESYVFVCPNDGAPTIPPSGLVLLP